MPANSLQTPEGFPRLPLRRRLFVRISLILSFLFWTLGPMQYLVLRWALSKADDVVLQIQQWGVAQQFANVMESAFDPAEPIMSLKAAVQRLNELNPLVDAYLLKPDGELVYKFAVKNEQAEVASRVRIEPILQFFEPESSRYTPLYGDDPDNPHRPAIFSAARLQLGGAPYILYAVVGGVRREYEYRLYSENYMARFYSFSSVCGVLVVVLFSSFIFVVLTRRVSRTVNTIRAFRDGDFSSRIGSTAPDELGELARTFDQMADTIEQSVDDLEKRDAMRRELIATISHDLRGPLANIRAHLERVQDRESISDTARGSLETVHRNTDQLGELLSQLFELAKLEAKEVTPQLEEHHLQPLFDDLVISYHLKGESLGVTVRYEVEPREVTVFADLTMLGRVLGNLVENALRFTSTGGEIVLRAEATNERVRLSVRDTGIGIAGEDLPKIFGKFYQAEDGKKRDVSSCGLGLSIVKRLVELQGAQIEVQSKKEIGTEFYFVLPQKEVR